MERFDARSFQLSFTGGDFQPLPIFICGGSAAVGFGIVPGRPDPPESDGCRRPIAKSRRAGVLLSGSAASSSSTQNVLAPPATKEEALRVCCGLTDEIGDLLE